MQKKPHVSHPPTGHGPDHTHLASPRHRFGERILMRLLLPAALTLMTPHTLFAAPDDSVAAKALAYRPSVTGYGRIHPSAPLWLRSRLDATVERLAVGPGQAVQPGTLLYVLGGAGVKERLHVARESLRAATQRLNLARKDAASAKRRYPQFANRQTLDRYLQALAAARLQHAQAEAAVRRLRAWTHVESPIAGRVAHLALAPGQQLRAGSRTLRLEPATGLALRARFFPENPTSLFVGEHGTFRPAAGGVAQSVRVVALEPGLTASGARIAWLAPVLANRPAAWADGAAGNVRLEAHVRPAVQVPPEALVLDRGRWWVLIRTDGRLHTQAVVPAPGGGSSGVILSGLKPGDDVVVRDAYRLFHRDFASHYTPPD